jgi:amino acid transporter
MSQPGSSESKGHLRANAITALGAATIAMAFMGPATSVFFNTPLGAAHMGYGLPFGTLLALLVCLAVASTIGGFSRRMPTAGFAYTFNTRAFGRGGGFVSGWLLAFAYLAVGPMLFAALGSFGHDFLSQNLSITVPWWVISLVALAIVLFIGSRSLDRSVETAIVFLVLEVGVMLTLFVTVLVKHSASLSLAPFNPGNSLDGFSGIGYGMLWGVLMFVGFESAGTLGEETRGARRSIPIALFSAVGIIGVFYVLSSYAAAIGFGSGGGSHAFSADAAPFTTLADRNWGSSVAWIVSLTVINSQFANLIS